MAECRKQLNGLRASSCLSEATQKNWFCHLNKDRTGLEGNLQPSKFVYEPCLLPTNRIGSIDELPPSFCQYPFNLVSMVEGWKREDRGRARLSCAKGQGQRARSVLAV